MKGQHALTTDQNKIVVSFGVPSIALNPSIEGISFWPTKPICWLFSMVPARRFGVCSVGDALGVVMAQQAAWIIGFVCRETRVLRIVVMIEPFSSVRFDRCTDFSLDI